MWLRWAELAGHRNVKRTKLILAIGSGGRGDVGRPASQDSVTTSPTCSRILEIRQDDRLRNSVDVDVDVDDVDEMM